MFGPRLSSVFASRWKALWWAAGILLTAYCSVPKPDEAAHNAKPAPKHEQANPWAVKPAHDSAPRKS
ncbi:MAG: hypothetical protein PHE36_04140 [Novosphingobium sp.]|nr:hypothetical protein [Novosphingobium sp.]